MTNEQLEAKISQLVREEREISLELLKLFREAEKRRLYLERGYPTLFEWLVSHWGYSQPAAHRRVQAARILEVVPAAQAKLQNGTITLTALSRAQSAIAQQEKLGNTVTVEAKENLLVSLEKKNVHEVERSIAAAFPNRKITTREKFRPVNGNQERLHLTLEKETVENLKRTKEHLSHSLPGATWSSIVDYLAKYFLKAKNAPRKKYAAENHCVKSWPALRRQILQRDQGRCQYQAPRTGHTCHSRHQVEVDHIIPLALGGTNHPSNLRALCRAHNLAEARRLLGNHTMDRFLPSPD